MTDLTLFFFGLLVFVMMVTGLVMTMVGFNAVTDRPDLAKGVEPSLKPIEGGRQTATRDR